jgi:hypothetical protein
LGLDGHLVDEVEQRFWEAEADSQSELENGFQGADRFRDLRQAICDQAENLKTGADERADELERSAARRRGRRRLRGGILGLCGVVVIGGNSALSLVTGGVALASTSAGGALIGLGGKEVFFGD